MHKNFSVHSGWKYEVQFFRLLIHLFEIFDKRVYNRLLHLNALLHSCDVIRSPCRIANDCKYLERYRE